MFCWNLPELRPPPSLHSWDYCWRMRPVQFFMWRSSAARVGHGYRYCSGGKNKSVPFSEAEVGGVGGQQVFEVVEDVRGFAEGVDLRGAHGFEHVMRHRQ